MKRLLRAIGTVLLVPLLLFEEWGWEPLAALVGRLARLPLWARLEAWVRTLPPWAALLAFGVPMLALVPVKLIALALFGGGHYLTGLLLLGGAKLLGTAVLARLFQLVQPTLMRLGWFARWYPRWKDWKDAVLVRVRQSALWRRARALRLGARRWWRRTGRGLLRNR